MLIYPNSANWPLEPSRGAFGRTGAGGRAMESLVAQKKLAAGMDFSLIEVGNHINGSVVSAGADRTEAAGRAGVPQTVAPGGRTLIDMQAWADIPDKYRECGFHVHNRLIACAIMNSDEKRAVARTVAEKLAKATGATSFIMPLRGIDEWNKDGGPFNDPEGLAAFVEEIRAHIKPPDDLVELDAHINDQAFADQALAILDQWVADGVVPPGYNGR